jgi:hypothetical protein
MRLNEITTLVNSGLIAFSVVCSCVVVPQEVAQGALCRLLGRAPKADERVPVEGSAHPVQGEIRYRFRLSGVVLVSVWARAMNAVGDSAEIRGFRCCFVLQIVFDWALAECLIVWFVFDS